jgi:hypothetical protein
LFPFGGFGPALAQAASEYASLAGGGRQNAIAQADLGC